MSKAKISSQDCVDFAVRNLGLIRDVDFGKKKFWTRTSKEKVAGDIVRKFTLFPADGKIMGLTGYYSLEAVQTADGLLTASVTPHYFNGRGKEVDVDGRPLAEGQPPAKPPEDGEPRFIYAVTQVEHVEGPVFLINTVSCWKKRHCLTDKYTERERRVLDPVFEVLGLSDLMESYYESDGTKTPEMIKRGLELAGIAFDRAFQEWVDRPMEGEEE
jgi:hypothetical protein